MPPVAAIPTNQPKVRNLPSKFIDRLDPLKRNVSAGFFLFLPPHPVLPQNARRAAVRNSFLLFDIFFPSALQHPSQALFALLRRNRHFRIHFWFFAQRTSPAFFPSVSVPKSALFVCATVFLTLRQATRTEALSRLCVHFCSPLPCRCFVLGWLLAVTVPHITIYRIFNHTRCICSILIMASKLPLHQSAGAVSLGNTAQF